MRAAHDAFYINGVHYHKLDKEDKELIEKTVERLEDWIIVIEQMDDTIINLITSSPRYTLEIQSEFPNDLTGKIVSAFIAVKNDNQS